MYKNVIDFEKLLFSLQLNVYLFLKYFVRLILFINIADKNHNN